MRPDRRPDLVTLSLWLLPLADCVITGGTAAATSYILTQLRDVQTWPWSTAYRVGIVFAIILTPLVFSWFSLYRSHRGKSLAAELMQISGAWFSVLGVLVVITVATKTTDIYSRVWMATWLTCGMVAFWLSRITLRVTLAQLRSKGWDTRDIVIIGAGPEAKHVLKRLQATKAAGFRIVGYFSGTAQDDDPFSKIRYLGTIEDVAQVVTRLPKGPDQAWICLPVTEMSLVYTLVNQLGETTLDCRFVPDARELSILNNKLTYVASLPVLELSHSPMSGMNRAIKAIEDRVLSACILLMIAPLMLIIAMAIKWDSPGPVLYRQRRNGWNGELITMLKFRSMYHEQKPGEFVQARRDDPRVTRVGRFLRRTSLDELPQFLNALAGSMSVVGPRPHAVEHNDLYKKIVSRYALRHKVKPGITGWAQVNGFRGETETLEMMKRRVLYDQYYIENWSVWFDLSIIALTIIRGFVSSKAY